MVFIKSGLVTQVDSQGYGPADNGSVARQYKNA